MKKTNKLISILLVLAMLLSMAPLSLTAFAAETVASGSTSSTAWSIDSDGVLTIDGKNKTVAYRWNSAVIAPWDDYADLVKKAVFVNCDNWTQIPDGTFRGHSNLTDVTLPPNITRIGEYAFTGAAIRSIVLPDSVTLIDYDAFSLCYDLTYINIPDGVETIRGDAFNYCYALKAISIPDSVTTLCEFSQCKSLTAVRLGNGLQKLSSFRGCSSLQSIVVPPSINALGSNLFGSTGVNSMYYQGTTEPTAINTSYSNHSFYGASSSLKIYVPEAYSSDTMGIKSSYANGIRSVTKLSGYLVNSAHAVNGVVTVDKGIAAENDTVNITLVPYGGYEVESVSVKQGETDIAVTGSGVNYSFTMPAGDVTVSAVFKESLHIHDFTYSAEGTTLKAVCSNTDGKCNYPVQQITANNSESYSFNKDYTRPVTFEGVIDGYYPEATYTMNGEPIEGEPYYPGEYVATLTKGDATLSVSYSITKATPSSSLFNYAKPSNLTYDGTAKYGTVTLKDGVEGLGDFTVIYRLGSSKGEITEPIKAGKYYMRALVEEGEYYKAGEVSLTNFTISCDHTACGTDYVPNNDGTHNETYGCGTVKTSNTDCSFADGVCEYCEYACLHEGQTGAVCELCKKSLHTHSFTYTASVSGDRIVATCTADGCPLENGVGGYIIISAPADLYTDGVTAKEAVIDNQLEDTSVTYEVIYSTADGSAPATAGTYTASITVGDVTASVEFELVKRSAAAESFVYTAPENLIYDGTAKYATVEVLPEITGMGEINVAYCKDGEAVEPINAGTYTVKVSAAESDKYYEINDVELGTFTIKTKDISDAFIILGDALTYTGEEQTQNVTTVEIPDDLDVTYTVSGNKATNVGVYLLTVTGTGNFSGEAKIAYEIAVDASGIDGITPLNVKSSDKAKIEYVYNQLDNAVTDLADDAKKAEWDNLKSDCIELLKMIENVANHLEWFKEDLAEYDIETVTSDDADDLEGLYESNAQWLYDFADNYTEEEIKEFSDALDGVSKLQKRISDVAKEITRITDAVNGYDKATVKSSDKADLEQLIADINALTTGNNITDSERADLLALADTVNELLAVISDTAREIKRITDAVDAYDIETVTSADKSDIEKLIEDIKALTDGDNITDAEREQLDGDNAALNALLDKIGATADEIARIENAVNGYDEVSVKSTDKADLEQLITDIKALTDGQNITDEERTNLENLDATADALLAKIAETTAEYDRVIAAANGYDEATVTSADKDTLVQLNEDIYALALTDNVTADEIENLENAHDKILGLIDKLTGISDEIKRIIEAVDKYVFESVKSSDKADIQQLIADIKALLDTQNITADERTLLEGADETCDKLVAKIDETVSEVNRINDATNAYDIDIVTSADKADIEKLLADIKALTDGDNITDTEREQLDGNEVALNALLDKIGATADEIERIENAVNSYDEATVKSTDKADLEQLVEDIKALTDATNITAEERAALEALDATVDSLIKKIDDTAAEIARIDEAVNAYDEETVKSSDIPALGKLIDDIKTLTDGDNITEDEKAALEADDAAVDALVEKLTEVAEEIKRVDEAVKSYDEKTIKSSDSDELTQLKDDVQSLIDSTNTTENEKLALGEMIADIEALEDKIDETAKEIERIENAVNGYDEETVKSSDEETINQLKEDIQTLIDSGNVTEEEISGLEDTKADADALTDKIDETQAEIDRINDAVNSYTEDTVKSTDTEAIEQLKEDIQNLIDGGNVTDEEISSLEDTKDKADNLTDKIAETENQLEEIGNIENGYDSETVTSDDKAAIEEAIAEIEAVNPDNLTDEQKAEYDEIKAEFEALLAEIEAADKAVSDIGVELEMFDENRVTIFWEDDIEALKAKIDELLADENMGTAEKAKLNEYKAQAEKLIEIINTPKEYISCRFFYFIWDCLTWKYNGILWLFSKIFGC